MPLFGVSSIRLFAWALLAMVVPAGSAIADTTQEEIETTTDLVSDLGQATERIIVPVPLSSPQLGGGLALGVAWFYTPEGSGRPWTTGAGALKTSNGTWAVAGFQQMALDNDLYRIDALGGVGRINSKFYGIGDAVSTDRPYADMSQRATYLRLGASARVATGFYAGARLKYVDETITLTPPADMERALDITEPLVETRTIALGPILAFDTTRESFARTSGVLVSAEWLFSRSLREDDDYDFAKANLTANEYLSLGSGTGSVLALRQSLCLASRSTRFSDLCQFGSNSNLRGYEAGEYRDRVTWSAQAEWRRHLAGKFGMVAFAGVGGVAGDLGSLADGPLLPSAGVGLRYLVARENGVNLRFDVAWGRHSSGIYVSIGEAF